MASESDSETTPQPDDREPALPDGLRLVHDRHVYRLFLDQHNPNEKEKHREWTAKEIRTAETQLAGEPNISAAIERLQALGGVTGWNKYPELFAEFYAGYVTAKKALDDEVAQSGPPSVHPSIRREYLAKQALPAWLVRALTSRTPATPAEVLFSDDDQPFALDPLQKGEIVIRLSAGLTTGEVSQHVVPLVTDALDAFASAGYSGRQPAGAKRLAEKKPRETRYIALQLRGKKGSERRGHIARLARELNYLKPGETGAERRVQRIFERRAEAGEEMLAAEETHATTPKRCP